MENQKDKETGLSIYDLSLFNKDPFSVFLYRKSQNLGAAIYLLTNHFSDQEPLKWNIRAMTTDLLQESLSFSFASKEDRQNLIASITSISIGILSLVEIGSIARLLSEPNFNILKKEFDALFIALEKENKPFLLEVNFVVDESNFKLETAEEIKASSWIGGEDFKGQNNYKQAPRTSSNQGDGNKRQKNQKDIKDSKYDRKEKILNLLKPNKEVSIKDISQAFSDCSEKTIQRELTHMVEAGTLKKIGERRWSRYSIYNP